MRHFQPYPGKPPIKDGFHISQVIDGDDVGQIVIDLLTSCQMAEDLQVFSPKTLDEDFDPLPHQDGDHFVVYGKGLRGGFSVYGPFAGLEPAEEFGETYRDEDDEWEVFSCERDVKTEQTAQKEPAIGRLWWIAEDQQEAQSMKRELGEKGVLLVELKPQGGGSSRVDVLFSIDKALASKILGYEVSDEEWLDESSEQQTLDVSQFQKVSEKLLEKHYGLNLNDTDLNNEGRVQECINHGYRPYQVIAAHAEELDLDRIDLDGYYGVPSKAPITAEDEASALGAL